MMASLQSLMSVGLTVRNGVQATKQHSGGFNWSEQWYAVAVADQLDPSRPNKATLLGQQLAVWRDSGGVWRAFEDRCPHRLAPLTGSLGRRMHHVGYCSFLMHATIHQAQATAVSQCGVRHRACNTAVRIHSLI